MNRKRTCTDLKIVVRLLESMSQAPIPEAGSGMRDPSKDVCYIGICVSTPKVLPLSTWACPMRSMKAARRTPSGEPFAPPCVPRLRPGHGTILESQTREKLRSPGKKSLHRALRILYHAVHGSFIDSVQIIALCRSRACLRGRFVRIKWHRCCVPHNPTRPCYRFAP